MDILFRASKLLYFFITIAACQRNNVCKTFEDYYTRDINPNCWYNPDVTANATQLITSYGYPVETYKTVTKDFYIITIFRIPKYNNPKGTVFLQHPATASSTIWVDLGNRSLAFMLSDAGYDVWMGNFRGTSYSLEHVYLSVKENPNRYWNFSFHEMGLYDMPAMFEVVMRETGYKDKLYYIGHSASTSTAFVYASLNPTDAAKYVKLFICWSPIAFLEHLKSPITVLAHFANLILSAAELTHLSGYTYYGLQHKLTEYFCFPWNVKFCSNLIQFISGLDPKHVSPERIPIMLYQNLQGYSLKGDAHFAQIYNRRGAFQLYNYGPHKNEYYYHSKLPPLYPIEKINVSMYFIYGGTDYLSVEKDVLHLYHQLRDTIKFGILKVNPYNHVDFHYAIGVEDMVYKPTLEAIERMRTKDIENA